MKMKANTGETRANNLFELEIFFLWRLEFCEPAREYSEGRASRTFFKITGGVLFFLAHLVYFRPIFSWTVHVGAPCALLQQRTKDYVRTQKSARTCCGFHVASTSLFFRGMCSPFVDRLTAADKRHVSKTHWNGKLGIAILDITLLFFYIFSMFAARRSGGPKKEVHCQTKKKLGESHPLGTPTRANTHKEKGIRRR